MKFVRDHWLPDDDDHLEAQIGLPLCAGRHTYQFRKFLRALEFTRRRRAALDVGAHAGLWTWVLSHHFDQVHAFEPSPAHLGCLRRNLAGRDNVTIFPVALSDRIGDLPLLLVAGNTGNTRIATADDAGAVLRVPARRLDDYDLDWVDFIKIDCEGFEEHVVAGGEHLIRRDRPVIIVEQKPGHAGRYDRAPLGAVEKLQAWGAQVAFEMSGDHCLVFP